jgi:hypothetical protein
LLDNFFEEKVRKKLLSKYQVSEIIDLSDNVFSDAIVHSMIFGFKNDNQASYSIKVKTSKTLNGAAQQIPNSFFLSQTNAQISIRNYEQKDFLEKLKTNCTPLENVLDIRQTIKTGDDSQFITREKQSDNFKPILRGKDVFKWQTVDPHLFVDYGDHLACPRDYRIFEQPKLLFREAGNEITATLDTDNYYIMYSLYNGILIDKGYGLKYLLAILNSSLSQYQLNLLTFEKTKGAFTKARIFHYYKLPIKIIDGKKQQPFIKLVDEILRKKKANQDTSTLEKEIDVLVYKLYELTYDEVKIIDKDFWLSEDEYQKIKMEK